MQLKETLLVFSLCFIYAATAEEVCFWESFNASCPSGEVVFIEKALFGRMHNNRCFNLTDNETSCSDDVRFEIQRQFGLKGNLHFKPSSDLFKSTTTTCIEKRMPFLEISYQCTKWISNEICIEETFNATCPPGTVIFIQNALYGRMRNSRCTDFIDSELNCYANVQPYISSVCNERIACTIKVINDDTLRHAKGSCKIGLKPYLEVFHTCVPEFPCPPFSLPKGATMQRKENGYHVICDNNTLTQNLVCKDRKWNIDPEQLCRLKDQLYLLVFSSAAGVFLLTAIIAVVVCLQRIQKNSRRKKTNRPSRQAGDEYDDYPESHLRRQNATCGSENEYEYEYEYEYDGQQDDGTYGSYSHVRDTGP